MKNEREVWKDVAGYEGLYQASNFGRLKNYPKEKKLHHGGKYFTASGILKPSIRQGYYIIVLTKEKKRKTHSVNRLIANGFVPNPYNMPEVNHEDGDKLNDRATNLTWATKSENVIHAYKVLHRQGSNRGRACSKTIATQKTMDGVFVKQFSSISSAERITGVSRHHIGKCIQGKRKSAGGFLWT